MFGLMLPLFIAFTAIAVDIAVIAVVRSQLSTAADSAALAGAQQLAAERVLGATTLTSGNITTINNQALKFAQSNTVLGATPVLSTNLSEIVVGYLDLTNPSSTLNSSSSLTTSFNSVQVTLSRDSTHGGPIPAFFSRIWGYPGTPVSVTSTASAQAYSVAGFQASGSNSASLLPIVLDMTTWLNMMPPTFAFHYEGNTEMGTAGPTTATDQYTYNASNNTVTAGADGIYESLLYPVSSGSPGNWGTIHVGVSNNGTSTLSAQIQYGITPAQLATFPNSTIQLDSTLNPAVHHLHWQPRDQRRIKSA